MQASVEVQLEFGKFFNVDLFQRGYYQLRCYARFSPKAVYTLEIGQRAKGRGGSDVVRSVSGNVAKTKIFQILYRKEDVDIDDIFVFKIDFLVDIMKVEEIFKEVDMQFVVEMWFAEEDVGTDQLDKFQLNCHRCLKLNFDPLKGLHSNVSMLFDYFHLSAVVLTVHASLLAFKHPIPLSAMSSKTLKQSSNSHFNPSLDLTGLELALFGPPIPPNSSNKNIIQAQKLRKLVGCQKHHQMCRYLLSAYESVQSSLELLISTCLPSNQQIKIDHIDCVSKLEELVSKCRNLSEMSEAEEEDVLQVVHSDLTNLNTQMSLLWMQYLNLVAANPSVQKHLARENHVQRVKRFAEGFFVREFSKPEALTCYDAGQHRHSDISAKVRLSEYFRTVPSLPVECPETDGGHLTLPIIFEDVYSSAYLPPNALMVSTSSASETGITKKASLRVTPNRWAQRNNSLKNTAARQTHSSASVAANGSASSAKSSADGTSVVWTTKASSSLITSTASDFNLKPNDSYAMGDLSGFDGKVGLRRDRSTASTGSQESESQLNIGRKKRISKFRPESLLLLGSGSLGVGWQQQQFPGGVGVQVAFDAPDCQLVGYKKVNTNLEVTPPTIELGTLSTNLLGDGNMQKVENNGNVNHPKSGHFISYLSEGKQEPETMNPLCEDNNKQCNNNIIDKSNNNNNNNNNDKSAKHNSNGPATVSSSSSSSLMSSSSSSSLPPAPNVTSTSVTTESSTSSLTKTFQMTSSSTDIASSAQPYISPATHLHHQTSSFLFSASSLPALNKDDEEDEEGNMNIQILNESCLLVAGGAGGSLPELIGGASKGSSDASGLSRSECQESIAATQKLNAPAECNHLCRSPSIKSLPSYIDKDVSSDPTVLSNNISKKQGCQWDNVIKSNSREGPTAAGISLDQSANHTTNALPVTDQPEPNRDNEFDALQHLTEEYKQGKLSLRESLSRMPDLRLERQEDLCEGEGKKDKDCANEAAGSKHSVSSSSEASHSSSSSFSSVSLPRRESRTMQISSHFHSQLINRRLVSKVTDQTVKFSHAKESLRKAIGYHGHFYSDYLTQVSEDPYFWTIERPMSPKQEGIHLIICVHGLDGNSTDLRLFRTYLEMSLSGRGKVDFLMSERNQMDTFSDFEVMTDRLVQEILYHIDLYSIKPARISFIGHSLGNIIIRSALGRKEMAPLLPKLHTFLSLSGPHLGMLFNNSGLINMGIWFVQKWKKSTSLLQLSLKDHHDPRQTFMYRLSQKQGLKYFRNVLLVGSQQDRYVPFHSSRIELCKAALRDTSGMGSIYNEMVTNLLRPLTDDSAVTVQIQPSSNQQPARLSLQASSLFVRYDVYHALTSNTNNLIGRAAHIAVLDSELFIEKFITVSVLKYFL